MMISNVVVSMVQPPWLSLKEKRSPGAQRSDRTRKHFHQCVIIFTNA